MLHAKYLQWPVEQIVARDAVYSADEE